jgi:hypothetical protein
MKKPKHFYKYVEPVPGFYHHSTFQLEIKQSTIQNTGLGVFSLHDIRTLMIITVIHFQTQLAPILSVLPMKLV